MRADAWSRRRFLGQALASMGLRVVAPSTWTADLLAQAAAPCPELPPGELVRVLPLYGEGGSDVPFGTLVGGPGLDARQYTDLARLAPDAMVTPTADMFVRTAAPPGLDPDPARWIVALTDATGTAAGRVTAAELGPDARPMGIHLIECSGNSNPQTFGLMSATAWDGVPLRDVLARWPRPAGSTGLLVSGRDHAAVPESRRSLPGASWILPAERLTEAGPFLALRMNGEPLTPHHGAPIRLVVPGWYGCAWIKWVDELRWVGPDEPTTPQMQEFAVRTHQDGVPDRAADYAAPRIDTAAMPVRVEQRRVGGKVVYDVVGIVWGGTAPVDALVIRFGPRDRGTPVRVCPAPASAATWTLWTHRWQPAAPGYYDITLRAADAAVPTRRLDLSFYVRRVRIDEV
jgi:hypothetical protein